MNIYHVCQNKNWKRESNEQYLMSPQTTTDGSFKRGYYNMSQVRKGDIIFHGADQKTKAISIAKEDYYLVEQPLEDRTETNGALSSIEVYRVDSNYTFLTTPLDMKTLYSWFKDHHDKESAFTINGTRKQGEYLSLLSKEHAIFIINKALESGQTYSVKAFLKSILKDILDEEYADDEIDEINDIIDQTSEIEENKEIHWKCVPGTQEFVSSPDTGTLKAKRNPTVAANALIKAHYECEYDHDPNKTFYKKSGVKYTEPHHLIPLSMYRDFEYEPGKYTNLDVENNIVSLCSYCHNLLHYGRLEDKKPILEKLFNERQAALKAVGIEINCLADLIKYYM